MRNPVRWLFPALFVCSSFLYASSDDSPDSALNKANKISSLTGPGAIPFHLKVSISEPEKPSSIYHATIEESWLSVDHWSRTVSAPNFKQVIYVDGSNKFEQTTGDYNPLWLRNFVTAALDPLENQAFWEKVSAKIVLTSIKNGQPSETCARAQFKIGTADLNNDAFAVICFNVDGSLSNVVSPDYSMEFKDLRAFGKKKIAYQLIDDPAPGTSLVGTIDLLEKIDATSKIDPSLTGTGGNITVVHINQVMFNQLAGGSPTLIWPPVHSGNTTGKLSMYVSTDKNGHIREAYPLNSDNAGLQEAVRDQLLKLQLKPAVSNGQRVQTEGALTFAFSTTMADSSAGATPASGNAGGPVTISPSVLSGLMAKSYAPVYPQEAKDRHLSGTVIFDAVITKNGDVGSLTLKSATYPIFIDSAIAAIKQWKYHPYKLNGEPVEVKSVITVHFNMG